VSRPSKRFSSSRWAELLVPALLVILLLILVGTIAFVILSSLGLFSGG